jgi:hypothetical protein
MGFLATSQFSFRIHRIEVSEELNFYFNIRGRMGGDLRGCENLLGFEMKNQFVLISRVPFIVPLLILSCV